MSNCFENLIGIKEACATTEPESGLYIQDLPFLDLKVADNAVETESSGIQLMRDKINYSSIQLKHDFQTRIAPRFRQNSILQNKIAGFYHSGAAALASESGYFKGIEVKIDEYPYLTFHLNKIRLYADTTGNQDIVIYDLFTGQLLDTIEIDLEAGKINEVDIAKSYETKGQALYLFIGYDAGETGSCESNINNTPVTNNCDDCNEDYSYINFRSVKIDKNLAKTRTNMLTTGNTAGLSITYTLSCSIEAYLCSIRHLLAWPLLHLAGAQLCKEVRFSKRLNSITTIDQRKAELLEVSFMEEYTKSMENLMKNMALPNDICFECNPLVKPAVIIP